MKTDIHETAATQPQNGEHPSHGRVSIKINGNIVDDVRPGVHTGLQIKVDIAKAPSDYELEQIINGNFITVPDDQKVNLHGGEEFIVRPKKGTSS